MSRDLLDDLDSLIDAVDALEEDGLDADETVLRDAKEVVAEGRETAQKAAEQGDIPQDANPLETTRMAERALQSILSGTADEPTLESAIVHLREYHEKLTIVATQMLLG